jgi:hypothetical protein
MNAQTKLNNYLVVKGSNKSKDLPIEKLTLKK